MNTEAGWLQAISIAITAFFAIRGLRTWRTQMIGQRKFEVAEEALRAFALCKMMIEKSRELSLIPGEGDDLMQTANIPEDARRRLRPYFATIERVRRGEEHFAKLTNIHLTAKILLGAEADNAFKVLWEQRAWVLTGADRLIINYQHGEEPRDTAEVQIMQKLIFAYNDGTEDKVQVALDKAEQKLTKVCEPHLRDTPTGTFW